MSIKKAAIQHREEREKEQLDDLSRKIDVIDVTIEDLEAALKHNKQLTPQGRTAIELKIETFKKKKDRLKTKLEKAQTQSVSYDDPRKRAGNHKQRIAKSSLVVISDQTAKTAPIPKIELEQKPQERNLDAEKPRNDQPSDKGLGVSESDKNKEWAKELKPKPKAKPVSNEQYFQTLVGFCRTHLEIEASEKQFQTEMREFLNALPELADKKIREDTHITFIIASPKTTGYSTSARFEWVQDGKRHTKTLGIAKYLNQTNTTDIPR